jgi:hypothetical protein
LTYKQFADRLETLTQKAKYKCRGLKKYWDVVKKGITVEEIYKVSWDSYMGYQHCELCTDRSAASDTDYTITNAKTNKSVFFSHLHLHLIREHSFFEGHTKYRLDPLLCSKVLNIKPNVDYSPDYKSQEFWLQDGGCMIGSCKTIEDYYKEHIFIKDKSYVLKDIMKELPEIKTDCVSATLQSILPNEKVIPTMRVWKKDKQLIIVSMVERDCVIGNIVARISEGLYRYSKKVVRWVED